MRRFIGLATTLVAFLAVASGGTSSYPWNLPIPIPLP